MLFIMAEKQSSPPTSARPRTSLVSKKPIKQMRRVDTDSVRQKDLEGHLKTTPIPSLKDGVSLKYVYPELPEYQEPSKSTFSLTVPSVVEVTSNTQLIGAQRPNPEQVGEEYGELFSELLGKKSKTKKLVHRVADCSLSDCESSADSHKEPAIVELPARLAVFEGELPFEVREHETDWKWISKKALKKQRQA